MYLYFCFFLPFISVCSFHPFHLIGQIFVPPQKTSLMDVASYYIAGCLTIEKLVVNMLKAVIFHRSDTLFAMTDICERHLSGDQLWSPSWLILEYCTCSVWPDHAKNFDCLLISVSKSSQNQLMVIWLNVFVCTPKLCTLFNQTMQIHLLTWIFNSDEELNFFICI